MRYRWINRAAQQAKGIAMLAVLRRVLNEFPGNGSKDVKLPVPVLAEDCHRDGVCRVGDIPKSEARESTTKHAERSRKTDGRLRRVETTGDSRGGQLPSSSIPEFDFMSLFHNPEQDARTERSARMQQ